MCSAVVSCLTFLLPKFSIQFMRSTYIDLKCYYDEILYIHFLTFSYTIGLS